MIDQKDILTSIIRNHRAGFIWSAIGTLPSLKADYPFVQCERSDVEETILHPELSRTVEISFGIQPESTAERLKRAGRILELIRLEAAQRLDEIVVHKLLTGNHQSGIVDVRFQSFGDIVPFPMEGPMKAVLGYRISTVIHSLKNPQ